MSRRVWFVLLTYVTRPMIWVLGFAYTVAFGVVVWNSFSSSTNRHTELAYPEIAFTGRLQWLEADYVDQMTLHGSDREMLSPSIVTAVIHGLSPSASHLRQLITCSHLRALKLVQVTPTKIPQIGEEEAVALSEVKRLEALSFAGCSLTPSIWQNLGKLPNLRYLDLSGCDLWGDYAGLETLSQLETLLLGSPGSGFAEKEAPLLRELKRLPRLKTLILYDYYPVRTVKAVQGGGEWLGLRPTITPTASDPLIDGLDEIRAISTLKTLYVNDRSVEFPGFDELNRQLPDLKVRPGHVEIQLPWIVGVVILSGLLMGLLFVQFQSQFSHVGAGLIPNYTCPHVIPVVFIWVSGILVNTIPMTIRGVPFLAALGLSLLPWGILCLARLMTTSLMRSPGVHRWGAILITVLLIGCQSLFPVLVRWNRSSVDWYFRGYEPGLASIFIVVGLSASVGLLWHSLRLYVSLLERGGHSPPLSFDMTAMSAWNQEVDCLERRQMEGFSVKASFFDRALNRAIKASARGGWRRRCDLWIAGNNGNGTIIPLFVGIAAAIAFTGLFWVGSDIQINLKNALVLVLSTVLPDVSIIVTTAIWRQRRSQFANESLRPVSRHRFASEIATAIAWDLVPLGGLYLFLLAAYSFQADPRLWSIRWTLGMLIFFMGRWVVAYGLTLWAIVIRRDWVVVLVALVAGFAFVFANAGIVAMQAPMFGVEGESSASGSGPLTGCALLLGTFGCVIAWLGYSRWQTMELA